MSDEQVDEGVTEEVAVIDELEPEPAQKTGFGMGSIAEGADDPIIDVPVDEWLQGISFDSTADVPIPDNLVDQVIGQEDAAVVIRKAAEQRRHMLMIGDPGTGKSMLAKAMTELMPTESLEDTLCYVNDDDENEPRIRTGTLAGSLLGDVRHVPFQSGGMETPAHERVEAGAIHKAHGGVLFIDEINLLRLEEQQALLTAMQEKAFPISGRSERSSGALTKTEAVPCDFILVAAGNLDAVQHMHPALRSRIRGYGYEVYVNSTMRDTARNRRRLIRFIAQEVRNEKNKKTGNAIPHFDRSAVEIILRESQRRAGRRGKLTLRLRELGGLVRIAGDLACEENATITTGKHVLGARRIARPLEQQVADRMIEHRLDYSLLVNSGERVGRVNGLAVLGANSGMSDFSGIMLPVEALVTPTQAKSGSVFATGGLSDLAKESVTNVSAVIKKLTGKDVSDYDIHIQFVDTHGVDGDSASITIATAIISAFEDIPIDQNLAMTGSLSVRGEVLPIGGVTAKIEAAAKSGIGRVIIPRANMKDVLIDDAYKDQVEVIAVDTLDEVMEFALVSNDKKSSLVERLGAVIDRLTPNPSGNPSA